MHTIDSIHTINYALVKLHQESQIEAARRERLRKQLRAAAREQAPEQRRRWSFRRATASVPAPGSPASASA